MRSTRKSARGWSLAGVGALVLALALVWHTGRKEKTLAVPAHPRSSPASPQPQTAADPPIAKRDVEMESHPKRSGDFATAMTAAMQTGDELNDDRDVFELGYRWVAVAPEAALEFVLNLPFDHSLLLGALVDEWTRRDPTAAAAWATRLPEGAPRSRVLPSLTAVWAENAPAEATRFANSLPPGETRNEAIVAATSGWAQQDPPAALRWAQRSLQGTQQEHVYTNVVFTWGQRDPVAAAEWLRAMPDGKIWDSATSALSGALVERYPALALSLVTNIADQEMRNERIENIARRWLEADRATAETALIQSDLPAPLVSRLLR